MSYRISYLVPKKEFERLIGKKQPRAVSPVKKSSTPRRQAKPKRAAEKRERTRKAESPGREKTRAKRAGVKKKRRVHE